MKRISLLLLFLFSGLAHAQLPDSLRTRLESLSGDSLRIVYLLEQATKVERTHLSLSHQLASEAVLLAGESGHDKLYIEASMKVAQALTYQNLLDSSRALYDKLLIDKAHAIDSALLASIYNNIGIIYYYKANDKEALDYFIRCFEIVDALKDTVRLAQIANNIGSIYGYMEDYKRAMDYMDEAIRYKLLLKDSARLGSSYHNMGIYTLHGISPDTARYYFDKAIFLRKKYNQLQPLASSYTSLANIFFMDKHYDSAYHYINEAIRLDLQVGDSVAYSLDLIHRAEYGGMLGKYQEGIKDALLGLSLLQEVKKKTRAYKVLAELYQKSGSYKGAAENWTLFNQLNDSIIKAEKEASLQELQVRFDTERKEAEIERLGTENELIRLKQEQEAQLRLWLVFALGSVASILLLIYRNYKRKAALNLVLEEKNKQLSELNFTKDRLFSIISHDLKSPLSSFHTITKSLTDNWERIEKEQLRSFIESLRDSSKEVHDMMDNLLRWALNQTGQLNYRPVTVNPSKVVEEVQKQLQGAMEAHRLDLKLEVKTESSLQADIDYLKIILRNLLSNAIKFSEMGKSIELIIDENETGHVISIRDFGMGMNAKEVELLLQNKASVHDIRNSDKKGTGLGITLCKELMQRMGGRIEIASAPNKGSEFTLVFPKAA